MTTTKKTISLNADGRIWISTAEGKLIGKGRVELMEKIKQFGNRRFSRPLLWIRPHDCRVFCPTFAHRKQNQSI